MKKIMRKWTVIISLALVSAFLLTGCSSMKLSEAFDEEQVKAKAEEVVKYMSDEDMESVTAMFSEEMLAAVPAERLQQNMDAYCGSRGAFVKIKSLSIIGQKLQGSDVDTAVAIAVTEYENQTITYQIVFNTGLQIITFYMK